MRHKSWPYYKDWITIFGKDRATGESGSGWTDAAHRLARGDKGKSPIPTSDDYIPYMGHINSEFDDSDMSACRGESACSPTKSTKKTTTKKRPRQNDEMEFKMVDMMSKFFDQHNAHLEKLVNKLGSDESASQRKKVFDALDGMGQFSLSNKLKVATALCEKKDFEIFFTTTEDNRQQLVWMILDGSY